MTTHINSRARKMYRKNATNAEGLTFWEWFRAANFARRVGLGISPAYKAWRRGEDPTEYAAV